MKNYYLLIALIFGASVSFAQLVQQTPAGTVEDFSFTNNQKSLDSCGFNVNGYLTTKVTLIEYYYMNIGDLTTPNTGAYPGRAQYYTANSNVTVSGVSFYAFISGMATSTDVVTSMYEAMPDSTLGPLLASDTIPVTSTSFGPLSTIQYTSTFDNAVTINTPYILTVETMSNDSLTLVSNSFTNLDGGIEHLGLSYYAWPTDPQYDGWFKHSAYAGWEADFLIMPEVKAEIAGANAFVLSSNDSLCIGSESTDIDYTQSSIFSERMYSANHASPLNSVNYEYVESQVSGTLNASYTYTNTGAYEVVARDTFKLWGPGGTVTECLATDTFDIVVLDTVLNGDYIYNIALGGLGVQFFPATSTDSTWLVKWIFDDMGAESTDLAPSHVFSAPGLYDVQMIISNGCYTDTVEKEIGVVGINEFDLGEVSIYPNPSKDGVVNITGMENKLRSLSIRNALGQVVYTNTNLNNQIKVDLSNTVYGVYFVTLESEDRKTLTRKLIISK